MNFFWILVVMILINDRILEVGDCRFNFLFFKKCLGLVLIHDRYGLQLDGPFKNLQEIFFSSLLISFSWR